MVFALVAELVDALAWGVSSRLGSASSTLVQGTHTDKQTLNFYRVKGFLFSVGKGIGKGFSSINWVDLFIE